MTAETILAICCGIAVVGVITVHLLNQGSAGPQRRHEVFRLLAVSFVVVVALTRFAGALQTGGS